MYIITGHTKGLGKKLITHLNDNKKKTVGLSFKLDDILDQLSHSEGHEFNIHDPSTINEEEAELIATMRAADVDGDGTISLMELSKMGSSLTKANRMAKHYKKVRAK